MISKNRLAGAVVSAGLLTSLLGMSIAQADPATTPRSLNGVGSDTTQGVVNGLSDNIPAIGSWDAVGTATFDEGIANCNAVTRPNGSGPGRAALEASISAGGDNCIQFGRSSSLDQTHVTNQLTYVPFAIDAVGFAVTGDSNLARAYTLAQLQLIYTCKVPGITPILPKAGSGTRKYWETQMGILADDANIGTKFPCIINGVKNGVPIEEHTGLVLDKNSMVPFSIGQYNSQANGTLADVRGKAVLGSIDGTIPQLTNDSYSLRRDVYNIIPTSKVGVEPWKSTFVGAGSDVCNQKAVIQAFGFALHPTCGDTSKVTS